MKWKKHALITLLKLTNDERANLNEDPLEMDDLKDQYNVKKWTKKTLTACLCGENSLLHLRKKRREEIDTIINAGNINTREVFSPYLDEYRFNYSYNRPVIPHILAFCIIEGIMNQILDYTPNDTSYIPFKKRWERFERSIIKNDVNKSEKEKMVRLYKNVRNRLLHGSFPTFSNNDKKFIEKLMYILIKYDVTKKNPELLKGIEWKSYKNNAEKQRPLIEQYSQHIGEVA